ncbi:hypothetical protein GGR53DRAFT_505392 [Hypoxylon sp. FL1150]|nr:hypothetical protein GGR53DRAFT_505392 [Hypoxylon sp. FL1150]
MLRVSHQGCRMRGCLLLHQFTLPIHDLRKNGWGFVEANHGRIMWNICNIIVASSRYRVYRVERARDDHEELRYERTIGTMEGFLELLEPRFIVVL